MHLIPTIIGTSRSVEMISRKVRECTAVNVRGGLDVSFGTNTETLGILVVHIHRATGVKGIDLDGKSGKYLLFFSDKKN